MLKSSETFIVNIDVETKNGKDETTLTVTNYDGDKYRHVQTIKGYMANYLYENLVKYQCNKRRANISEVISVEVLSDEEAIKLLKGDNK